MNYKLIILFQSLIFSFFISFSQNTNTVVKGKIIDAKTGETIPFATVVFTGTQDGTISDINGTFTVKTTKAVDSIEVAFVGYVKQIKQIIRGKRQQIDFELSEDVKELEDVIITPGENPAFAIMRKVKENKIKNDLRVLKAYNYEKYAKKELALKNAHKKVEGKKVLSGIMKRLDSLAKNDTTSNLKWDEGKTILPYYISETLSDYYYRKDPVLTHEKVKKTQSKGIKLSNGSIISKVVGGAFQDYNFYQNWITIFNKEFVSPVADSWRASYRYELEDSLDIDGDFCYYITFEPINDQNLAFTGNMYITKGDYAIKKIHATIPSTANINLIDRVILDQEMFRTRVGAWLPKNVKVSVDMERMSEKGSGILARYNCSMKDHQTNTPRAQKFYLNPYVVDQNAEDSTEEFWKRNRHQKMSKTDKTVFNMVDSIKRVPNVSTLESIMNLIIYRYIPSGKFDIGPYTSFIGYNNVEGLRLGYAMRTRDTFSKKIRFGIFGAYGFKDKKPKYQVYSDLILNRERWTNFHIEHTHDLEPVWIMNKGYGIKMYEYTFSHFGKMRKPFYTDRSILSLERQLGTGLTQTLQFKRESLNPAFDFTFISDKKDKTGDFKKLKNIRFSEVSLKTRFARDEVLVLKNNERIPTLPNNFTGKWPIFEFTYSYGIPNFLGSDLNYHKFELSIAKRQKMGLFGLSWFRVELGQVIGRVPFPILFNPAGNESPIYLKRSFNMMKFFEFSSDRQIAFFWRHSFEGILMNKIPLIRKLKARLVLNVNVLYGSMSEENKKASQMINPKDGLPSFYTLEKKPYAEVALGVENIFKLFLIQFYRRVTYTNHDVNKYGIKFYTKVDF